MKPEDKQRIEEAAKNYGRLSSIIDPEQSFKSGATYEHNYLTTQVVEAERKGWNEAIDAAYKIVSKYQYDSQVSALNEHNTFITSYGSRNKYGAKE